MTKTISNIFKINVTSSVTPPWTPPYPVPTLPGQVVPISGRSNNTISKYKVNTNVWADVKPAEVGVTQGNEMLWRGDGGCGYMPSYSPGGVIAIAGAGGHHGRNIYGCGGFDFTDARWKRWWTSAGVAGDNVAGELSPVDVRTNTRTHNCLNPADDIHDIPNTNDHYENGSSVDRYKTKDISSHTVGTQHVFNLPTAFNLPVPESTGSFPAYAVGGQIVISGVTGTGASALNKSHTIVAPLSQTSVTVATATTGLTATGGIARASTPDSKYSGACWNYLHWLPDSNVPFAANPWEQTWENTRPEQASWSTSTPHGWKHPGQWAGAQQAVTGRTLLQGVTGFIGNGIRHTPTVGLPLPCPGHTWDYYFNVPTSQGGGPKGSIAFMRSTYMGHSSGAALHTSWRFDFDTGQWSQWSVNNSSADSGAPCTGSAAGTRDPVKDRLYMISQSAGNTGLERRIAYLNMGDRTWRSISIGASTSLPVMSDANTGRTENIKIDPVRRLMIMCCEQAPHVRAFDLSTVGPEPIPTAGTGGWWNLPITAGAGSSIDKTVNTGYATYNFGWHYYPPNGKYYKLVPNLFPRPSGVSVYNSLGNFSFTKIHRLTPPPIIANPPANWYVTQPWTYDLIDVGLAQHQPDGIPVPLPRNPWGNQISSIGDKWFWYIPPLGCFAYCPLDYGGDGDAPTANCVYLIQPY